jgi:diguanylate cyclase (GGDEF)-like protein
MPYALIADLDPSQAQIYRHIAKAQGLDPMLVRDGAAALTLLKEHGAPALTMTELSLPRVDGFRLIEEIRKLAPEEYAPVVVISAFRNLREAALAQKERLGISALLARSTPVESILRTVKKVLAASSAPHGPAQKMSAPPTSLVQPEVDEERAEEVRLHHLDQMGLVEAGAEQDQELRAIVNDVARRFSVPVALITLVLEDRQWFKAHVGLSGQLLEARGSPRDWSFCAHVVQGRMPLIVPDAALHPAFANNTLVKDGTVRSYAGVPLENPSGDILGSLCIIDAKPMSISAEDVDALIVIGRAVAGELELRASRKRQVRERSRLSGADQQAIAKTPQLFAALSYLSAVLDNIDNGVFLLDPARRVVFANQAAAEIFARTADSLVGRDRDDILEENASLMADPDGFRRRLQVPATGAYALRAEFEMEKPVRRFVRWSTKPVDVDGGVGHLIVLTDVTSEMDLVREREQLARTDMVTSLVNRRGAEEMLEREASRAQRFGSRVSVVVFDLDHFKQVNDRHGQGAGDEVLRAVAQALNTAMRGIDLAARWGGDELLAILPNTGADGARSFAERVRATVEQLDPGIMYGVTLSSGVAELAPGESWEEAVRRAGGKLYEAKEAGRNRVA